MAELKESSSPEPNSEPSLPSVDVSHLESQLVSMNFVLKNTQSEVIKLQKVLMRYQNRQDELEKMQAKTEEQLQRALKNQKEDSAFRGRFLSSLILTALLSIVISLVLARAFAPSPQVPAAPVATENILTEDTPIPVETP